MVGVRLGVGLGALVSEVGVDLLAGLQKLQLTLARFCGFVLLTSGLMG